MIKNSHCEDEKITCHTERRIDLRVSASHYTEIPNQVRNDMKSCYNTLAPCGRGQGEGLKSLPQTLSRICKFAFCSLTNSTLSQRERVKYGFTLAEVLITLGIIGVVAAMTLPALVQHYRKVEYSSRLKKFYSSMNQAILLSQVQNGSPSEWNKVGTIYDNEGKIDGNANNEFASSFFLKYLGPYMKYTKIERGKVYFADGSTASMWNGGCIDFHFDVNGDSKPNQAGRDVFVFILCSTEDELWGCGKQKYFCSYYGGRSLSRTTMLDNCKNNPGVCSGLLIQDGLEFKKDYPHKL